MGCGYRVRLASTVKEFWSDGSFGYLIKHSLHAVNQTSERSVSEGGRVNYSRIPNEWFVAVFVADVDRVWVHYF